MAGLSVCRICSKSVNAVSRSFELFRAYHGEHPRYIEAEVYCICFAKAPLSRSLAYEGTLCHGTRVRQYQLEYVATCFYIKPSPTSVQNLSTLITSSQQPPHPNNSFKTLTNSLKKSRISQHHPRPPRSAPYSAPLPAFL